jgi:RNA recognition motif-containing protein
MESANERPYFNKPTNSRSICVKNLPPFADDLWMYRRFSQYGAIHSVRAMLDAETGQCQGLGFVNFINYLDAQSAIANTNGAFVDGKRLVVEIQRPRRKPVAAAEDGVAPAVAAEEA